MSEATHSPARRRLIFAAKLAVSVALLALLFSRIDARQFWNTARHASLVWLAVALLFYAANVLLSVWRWRLLLDTQAVDVPSRRLLDSYLVALFFNNFLPSNIGGDVIRIRDTAQPARSKTLATLVVLADRVIGVIVLALIAAVGATMTGLMPGHPASPIWPPSLWAGFVIVAAACAPIVIAPGGVSRLLQPLTVLHPEWIGGRIESLTNVLVRFRERPSALASCFAGAVMVQGSVVLFYFCVAYALGLPATVWDLAVIVPLSFIVQMLPVSMNGFGVREATFAVYFSHAGMTREAGVLVSLVGAVLTMLFSLTGAPVYISRRH